MSGPAIGGALFAVSVVEVDKLEVNILSIIIKLQLSFFALRIFTGFFTKSATINQQSMFLFAHDFADWRILGGICWSWWIDDIATPMTYLFFTVYDEWKKHNP